MTNADLEKIVDTSDSWITERTGIRERRILDPALSTSDLATEAARKACSSAGVSPTEIDCIIVGTVTPDVPFPATATYVQTKLGARPGGAAFDLSAACAGFLYGLSVADAMIVRGQFRRVLVIGVEILSRIIDWTDRNTCVLFGDGAGAVLLAPESDDRRGVLSTHLHADGSFADLLYIPAGGAKIPLDAAAITARQQYVKMNGREVFKQGVKNMSTAARGALEANALVPQDVSWVFAHQANLRIIEGVAERIGVPMSRFFVNIDRYGNTSSASLPIALDEAVEAGRLRDGDILVFTALGGGLAWASAVMRW
jgi:3-oxoacyl-[acyl-carrier-protein] synthase-3